MTYSYSPEHAQIYSQLGVSGTTYEMSFRETGRLLGDMRGRTALDFGCGTGRSARLLKSLGAERVIGVDRSENMIKQARANSAAGIDFYLMREQAIPLPDAYVDLVLSAHSLVEIHTLDDMGRAVGEMARVLKPGGELVVISTNPACLGYEFISYAYPHKAAPQSGDLIPCIMKGETPFIIDDTYWTEEDYRRIFVSAGFGHIQAIFPLAEGEGWLDETRIAPDIVFHCTK